MLVVGPTNLGECKTTMWRISTKSLPWSIVNAKLLPVTEAILMVELKAKAKKKRAVDQLLKKEINFFIELGIGKFLGPLYSLFTELLLED